jgi:membrane-bound serine protease (ClpP class)
LVIGASLLVAEAHVASYGVLGLLGAAAIAAGAGLAFSAGGASLALAIAVTVSVAAVLGALALVTARASLRVARRRALGGGQGLVGRVGVVRRAPAPVGVVLVMGELWQARTAWAELEPAPAEGDDVIVEEVRGLTLWVRRAEEWEVQP